MAINDFGTLATTAATEALRKNLGLSALQGVKPGVETKDVAREFTALLYLEVLKAMRAASPEGGFGDTDQTGRDIYNSMMDAELARVMAKHDNTGLTDIVERSMQRRAPVKLESHDLAPVSSETHFAPAAGVVSSRYGVRQDPFTKRARFHEGIDIAAPAGAPVRAPMAGEVTFSGTLPGYGNTVEVDHGNGLKTRYAHNSVNRVAVGEHVQPGDVIALVGSTGRSTGAHVHVEARQHGKTIDPKFLFERITKPQVNSLA